MASATTADLETLVRRALAVADELDEPLIGALLSGVLDRLSDQHESE
jgi:hypothetical protein